MALTKIDDRGITYPLDLIDNEKIRLGTGNDLEIYHDGTDSLVKNATNDLILQSTGDDVVIKGNDDVLIYVQGGAENSIICRNNGTVELHYDGSKKFETGSYGFGTSANIRLLVDDGSVQFGADQDFKIYHDGNYNIIKGEGAHSTQFWTDNTARWRIQAGGHIMPEASHTYDIGTTSYGVRNVYLADSGKLQLGTSQDLQIYHDGTNSYLTNSTGYLFTQTDNYSLGAKSVGENMIVANVNDGVDLYYDNTKRFETTADGATLTGRFSPAATDSYGLGQASLRWANLFLSGDIDLLDSDKLKLGNSDDLQIYHDGSHNKIAGVNGNTHIETGGTVEINKGTTENMAKFIADGAVNLYYDGVRVLETYQRGITVYGPEGDHGEVYIYADEGNDNADKYLLQSGTDGAFYIKNFTSGSWEVNLKTTGNGNVELYYDNVKKLHTYSGGVEITGHINMAANSNIYTADNGKLMLGTGSDLQIYHDGSNSYVNNTNASAHLVIQSAKGVHIKHDGEDMIKGIADAAVELYYDNLKKLETDANGIFVYGQESGNANLYLYADEGDDDADKWSLASLTDGSFQISNRASGGFEANIECNGNGNVELYYDNSLKLSTDAHGVQIHDWRLQLNAAGEGEAAEIYFYADQGDDSGDCWRLSATNGDSGSGSFYLQGYPTSGLETFIRADNNGPVNLYYDNSLKFETTSTGAKCNQRLDIGDNAGNGNALAVGDSQDLQIYHGGGNSYLKTTTGHMFHHSQYNQYFRNQDGSETRAVFAADGACALYYDNSQKFETHNLGVTVAGGLWVTGDYVLYDNKKLYIGDGNDLQIFHDATVNRIDSYVDLFLRKGASENMAKFNINSSVDLYFDATKRFETTSTGITVTGATSSFLDTTSPLLEIRSTNTSGEDARLRICGSRTTSTTYDLASIEFCSADNSGGFDYTEPLGVFVCRKSTASTNKGRFYWVLNTSTGDNLTTRMDLQNDGDLNIDGSLSENSDVSLKKNVVTIANALSKVKQLRGVEFDRIETDRHEIGCIAQEVQSVIPDVVKQRDEDNPLLTLSYNRLTAVLIEAVKELADKVAALESS